MSNALTTQTSFMRRILPNARAGSAAGSAVHFAKSGAGKPIIEVYVENDAAESQANLPKQIENVPVRIVVTGPVEAP